MKKHLLYYFTFIAFAITTNMAKAQIVYFSENFTNNGLPFGWTNDSLGLPASHLWYFNNPYARAISGANFDANFAIFDSDQGSVNNNVDEIASLTTGLIDVSAASGTLFLSLDEQYRFLAGPNTDGSSRRIEMSSDSGTTWTTVIYDSVDVGYPNPAVTSAYDISAAAGSTGLKIRFTWTGSWDWWWAIDNMKLQNVADPCAGVVLDGIVAADSVVVCNGDSVHLSFTPDSTAALIPIQWMQSADGINFVPISGATSNTYSTVLTAQRFFSVRLNCGTSTFMVTPLATTANPTPNCTCYPFNALCNDTDMIKNVTLKTLNNSTSCDSTNGVSNYNYYPSGITTTILKEGRTYNLSVTTGGNNKVSVWIDYNRNNDYEASEWTQVCTTSAANVANTVAITIPDSVNTGLANMRVRISADSISNAANDACSVMSSGETEDYEVTLTDSIVDGLHQLNMLKNVQVYPRYTNGIVTINLGKTSNNTIVSVYDIAGNLLETKSFAAGKQTIDLSSWSNGLYFISINAGNENYTTKVVLSR